MLVHSPLFYWIYGSGYLFAFLVLCLITKHENVKVKVKHLPFILWFSLLSWLITVIIVIAIIPWDRILEKELF